MANPINEQVSQYLNSPSKRRNLWIGIALLLSLAGFGSLIFWNNMPDYQILFSNLSPEDAGEMVNKLKDKKIPFQLSHNGTSLQIPKEQVYNTRLALAAEGLPKGGGIGFEVFDRTHLGATDFVQRLNYQRAMQGELSRTIKQIKEVEQARVHIVTPKDSLFIEERKKPTASVFIKTRSGMVLGPSQVEGIVHLVASAIEGLEPGSITIVDTFGKILSKRHDSTLIGQLTTSQLDYQRNLEEGLKKKVQGMLEEVLGVNKAIARVAADIDFQQVDITEERIDPNTVLRSEQKNIERSSSNSGVKGAGDEKIETPPAKKSPKGKTGASSELNPTGPSRTAHPFQTNSSERQNEIRNYEITKINKHIKNPVGSLKKVSVAVIVDGTYKEVADPKTGKVKEFIKRSPEEMKSMESIIKKAVGFNEARGDQVEVINMPFNWAVGEEEPKSITENQWKEYLLISYKPVVSLILALLFIFFVVRPILQKKPDRVGENTAYLPEKVQPALSPPPLAETKTLDVREQALQLAQGDPSKTVGIVKTWLNERE
jgi:flagellar M-ring protein FliF